MIFVGADHRGFGLKVMVERFLKGRGFEFEDLGAFEYSKDDDYADFAIEVAQKVAVNSEKNLGILICGSGTGMNIAANKVKGVRATIGFSLDQVHASRRDDNINILVLASDNTDEETAMGMVEKFLYTEFFETERYQRRIEKISRFEKV